MIARTWHGRVPSDKTDAYDSFLQTVALPDYKDTKGNRGVMMLRRTEDGVTHYVLTTLWDSIEAIKRFAGEDYQRARYYPQDDGFLLEKEPLVVHHEVLYSDFA